MEEVSTCVKKNKNRVCKTSNSRRECQNGSLLACLLAFFGGTSTKLFTDGVLLFWELFGVGSTEYSYF